MTLHLMTWRAISARPYPEILRDFAAKRLDYFVTGYGTGGTFQAGAYTRPLFCSI